MDNHSPATQIARARAGLILDQPFFGSLALRMTPREDPSAETMWTDGTSLGYNPAYVAGLSLDELKGVLAHEVLHVAAAHHARRQERDARRWNVAADYAINDVLTKSGFRLPAGALTGWGSDESAESIYTKLPPDPPGAGNGTGGDGDGAADPGRAGEVRDAPGPDGGPATPDDMARVEADARVAVSQAAVAAKACGNLPAGVARLVEEVLAPRVPWREVMRRFVSESARNDYTWQRPSTRYLHAGLYLPALFSEEMRPLAVAIDTSGSIDRQQIAEFAAELTGILQDTRTSATVVYCDADVQGVAEFGADEPVKLDPHGGGGTDFRPPFAEIERRGLAPSCLVYLTDGDCQAFPAPPDYPVLWAITTGGAFRPPFGEVVRLDGIQR